MKGLWMTPGSLRSYLRVRIYSTRVAQHYLSDSFLRTALVKCETLERLMRRLMHVTQMGALLLAVAVASARPERLQAQTVNVIEPTQVISADDLRSMGIARLGDVLTYFTEVRVLSLDGFNRTSRLGGIGSFHEPGPQLFVDGHPLHKSIFEFGDLDLLGPASETIERVEIFARPALISGVFAGEGAIHIFTKQADAGSVRLHGRATVGHRQASAGPLDFAPGRESSYAIEGPDAEFAGIFGLAGGSAVGSVLHRRHAHAERPDGRRPMSVATAALGSFNRTTERLHLSAIGHGSRVDGYPFLTYGADVVATHHSRGGASAIAAHALTPRSFLRHRATLDFGRTRQMDDADAWSELTFSASSAIARMLQERLVNLGASVELRRLAAGTSSSELRWGSVFAAIAGTTAPGVQYRGGGMVAMDGRSVAVKAYGGISVTRWPRHSAEVYVAIVDGLIHEQNLADYWMRRELMHPLLPSDVQRPQDDVSVKATFDAGWRWQPSVKVDIRAGAGIRRSQKVYLPELSVSGAGDGGITQRVEFHYTSGTQATAWADITMHLIPGRQRVFGSWYHAIAGDELYDDAWDEQPDLRIGLSLASPIVRGFRGWAAVIRESGSTWRVYDGVLSGRHRVGAGTSVDIFLSRRLLAGRIRASVGVRNALSSPLQTHPLGDVDGRSIRFDIRIDLARNR